MEEFKKSITCDPEQYKLLLTETHFCILSKDPTYPFESSPIVGCEYTTDHKDVFKKIKGRVIEVKEPSKHIDCYDSDTQRNIKLPLIPLYKSNLSSGDISSVVLSTYGSENEIVQKYEKIPFDQITDFYTLKNFNILVFIKNKLSTNRYGILTNEQIESNFVECLEKSKSPAKVTCNH